MGFRLVAFEMVKGVFEICRLPGCADMVMCLAGHKNIVCLLKIESLRCDFALIEWGV